eukprot:7664260-Pyramimonas_sp.AAC.1
MTRALAYGDNDSKKSIVWCSEIDCEICLWSWGTGASTNSGKKGTSRSGASAFGVRQKETIGVDPTVVLRFPELVEAPVPQLQRKISQSISKYQTAEFLESLSPYESARVISA